MINEVNFCPKCKKELVNKIELIDNCGNVGYDCYCDNCGWSGDIFPDTIIE